ncbi:DJ-1/PfpI family protein [Candidatus Woesearchaeota archaeon]|nr:DJ-1/PfpI family protein [Candidatus Woesearchaeota archaeon]
MARIAMLIAPKDFRDEEYLVPKEVFEKAGHKVTTASIEKKVCTGMLGAKVLPNKAISELNAQDFDVILVVGGGGAPELSKHKPAITLLKDAKKQGNILAAICLGPTVLATAGVLTGCRATVWPEPWAIKLLKDSGAEYTGMDVEACEHYVTASGPKFAKQFAAEVMKQIH